MYVWVGVRGATNTGRPTTNDRSTDNTAQNKEADFCWHPYISRQVFFCVPFFSSGLSFFLILFSRFVDDLKARDVSVLKHSNNLCKNSESDSFTHMHGYVCTKRLAIARI